MAKSDSFYEKWMARSVRVASGPFVGATGTVQAAFGSNVKVDLSEPPVRQVWFRVEDLTIEEHPSGSS